MHSSCVRLPTCSDTLFQSSLYISSACGGDSHTRSSRRAREAPSPALLSRLPRGSLACDTHVPRQAQGESPSSTWKGQGLTKRPQSLPGTGPGAGSRETGRITPSPLPSAAGTLAAPLPQDTPPPGPLPPGAAGSPAPSTREWRWLRLCSAQKRGWVSGESRGLERQGGTDLAAHHPEPWRARSSSCTCPCAARSSACPPVSPCLCRGS